MCVGNSASPVAGKKRKSNDHTEDNGGDQLAMSQINPSTNSAKRQRLPDQPHQDLSSSDTSESTIPPSWLNTHTDDEPASSDSSESTIPPSCSIEHCDTEADHAENILPAPAFTDSMLESKYDSQPDHHQPQTQPHSNDDVDEIIRSVSNNSSHQRSPQQRRQQQPNQQQHSQQEHSLHHQHSQEQQPSQPNIEQTQSPQQQQHQQQNTPPTLITPLSIANHPKLLRKYHSPTKTFSSPRSVYKTLYMITLQSRLEGTTK